MHGNTTNQLENQHITFISDGSSQRLVVAIWFLASCDAVAAQTDRQQLVISQSHDKMAGSADTSSDFMSAKQ